MTVVSGNIRFIGILAGIPWGGRQTTVGLSTKLFSVFTLAMSSDPLEIRPTLLYTDIGVHRRLSTDPKILELSND